MRRADHELDFSNVDEYIALFPPEIRERLALIRQVIKEAAPEAEEGISYGMPAYRQNGVLVYFAAQKHHIGFYPTGSGIEAFRKELMPYRTSKGGVQFQNGEPVPYDLIGRMVRFRVQENLAKKAKR